MTRTYRTFNYPDQQTGGKTLLTGIRQVSGSTKEALISGWYQAPNNGKTTPFVYKGGIYGNGTFHVINYPSAQHANVVATNWYGPNNGENGHIQVVGNYFTLESPNTAKGALYVGPLNGSGEFRTLLPTSVEPVINVIAHSTMGGLVVGNYDTNLIQGKAFIYDIKSDIYVEITKPGAKSLTAYGIWHNGGHHYTITGGYTNLNPATGIDTGYIVDWNNETQTLSNWRSYTFNNSPLAIATHFDGITSDCHGGYNLTGTGIQPGIGEYAFFANVRRKRDGSFSKARWEQIQYKNFITTGNSVAAKAVIGVYKDGSTVNGYIAY